MLDRDYYTALVEGVGKEASAKWRDDLRAAYGTPKFEGMYNSLVEEGKLNPPKEERRLRRHARKIIKKRGYSHLIAPDEAKKDAKKLRRIPFVGKAVANKYRKFISRAVGGGGTSPGLTVLGVRITTPTVLTPRNTMALPHESFETLRMKPTMPVSERIANFLKDKNPERPYTSFFSHKDPTVLLRESQTLPFLTPATRGRLEKIRNRTGEAEVFRSAGLRYGSTRRISKRDVKALDKAFPYYEKTAPRLGEEVKAMAGAVARSLKKKLLRKLFGG